MRTDVAIVGAGTAGAALAVLAARAGLRVVCVERRPLDEAGARWVNGVSAEAFDAAGLERPRGEELAGSGHAFHLLAGWGPERISIRGHELMEVDMRHLVARLQTLARDCGAELLGETRVIGLEGRTLETTRGPVRADTIVDASGLAGARLLEQPRVRAIDICAAAQEVRAVVDLAAARAFFELHRVQPGETLCFTGIAGGYSIVNVRLIGDRISILTGSIPADGHASGLELLDDFVRAHAWVGERLFGGSRAVPLRRPLDRLVQGRVALLGDAACQVFSPHGSGIGAGLIAARMLADVLGSGEPLHQYAKRWQRRHGGLFAGYDAFRQFSRTLSVRDLERMMGSGLLDAESASAGLMQRLPRASDAARMLRGAMAERRLAARLAPAVARTTLARVLYATYPGDPNAVENWSRRARRLLD